MCSHPHRVPSYTATTLAHGVRTSCHLGDRNHVRPQQNKMDELLALCQAHGIHMDISSSGALQASLNILREVRCRHP
eukprot:1149497-Pelagomonas_calceolata.AAC.3